MAMRWTAHDASRELKTLYQVNRAQNYDQFISAFQYFTGPPLNFAFGSASGDIALTIQGKFPVKWEGQGKFLMSRKKRKIGEDASERLHESLARRAEAQAAARLAQKAVQRRQA